MERLNGKTCSKVFARKDFADVRYIRRMLVDVFTALDLAQKKLGFHRAPQFKIPNTVCLNPKCLSLLTALDLADHNL